MSSNQSVSGQPSPAPTAHGVCPFAFSLFVSETSWAHVFAGERPYFLKSCGRYQTRLFEFPLAGTP